MCVRVRVHVQSCLTLCDSMDCSPSGSSVHRIFPGRNAGVGCHFLLQGTFPTRGWNLRLHGWQEASLPLSQPGSPECTPRCVNASAASKKTLFQHVIYSQGLYTFQMTSPGLLVHKKISKWDTHWLMWQITGFAKWKRTKTGRENILFSIYRILIKLKPSILWLHFPGRGVFSGQENTTTNFCIWEICISWCHLKTHYLPWLGPKTCFFETWTPRKKIEGKCYLK